MFSRCSISQNIWSQFQVFFSNYFAIPNVSPQSAILGFMEEIQDQDSIIINYVLLICEHFVYLSKNSESLNFVSLGKYISELKTIRLKRATF